MLACLARNFNFEAIRDVLKRITALTLAMTWSGGNIETQFIIATFATRGTRADYHTFAMTRV